MSVPVDDAPGDAAPARRKQLASWTGARMTIVAVDLRGFTAMVDNAPDAAIAEAVCELYDEGARIAETFGGDLFFEKGDNIAAIFDDEIAAAHCRQALFDYFGPSRVQVGMATGRTFVIRKQPFGRPVNDAFNQVE